jgi:hypothetical protein
MWFKNESLQTCYLTFQFEMKSHRRRTRPRREFLSFALRIKPNFTREAMEQFIDAMNGLETPGISYQEQFRLLERFHLGNARRDRYNRKRRYRKLHRARVLLRYNAQGLMHLGMLLRAGYLSCTPLQYREGVSGLYGLDLRFTRKLALECEFITEWLSTTRNPAHLELIPETGEEASDTSNTWAGREKFLASLAPTPVPAAPCPNTVSIDCEQPKINDQEQSTEEAAPLVACA